jgi:hypothetical protein
VATGDGAQRSGVVALWGTGGDEAEWGGRWEWRRREEMAQRASWRADGDERIGLLGERHVRE